MNLGNGVPLLNLNQRKPQPAAPKAPVHSVVQGFNALNQGLGWLANNVPAGTPPPAPAAPTSTYRAAAPAYDPVAAQQRAAENARLQRVGALRSEITSRNQAIMDAYNALFGDMDNVVRERSSEVERKAGRDIEELTSQYTGSIPGLVSSYAAVGAADSTDTADAKDKAKAGFDKSVETVGENKKADLAKIGSYANEQKAKWNADRDSISRLMGRVGETEDEGDLRSSRNQVEDKIGALGAERASLTTDQGARGKLSEITADAGRFDAVKSALDNVINSSLAGGVKAAAVQAVMDSSDLSEEDKNKVKTMYGNVYDAPAAA